MSCVFLVVVTTRDFDHNGHAFPVYFVSVFETIDKLHNVPTIVRNKSRERAKSNTKLGF